MCRRTERASFEKKVLDEVEPRSELGRGGELEALSTLGRKPAFGLLGDVRLMVEDQFDRRMRRVSSIEDFEPFDELAAAMSIPDQSMNLAGEQVNSQQAHRTVALSSSAAIGPMGHRRSKQRCIV
jgi:hypothetical protein